MCCLRGRPGAFRELRRMMQREEAPSEEAGDSRERSRLKHAAMGQIPLDGERPVGFNIPFDFQGKGLRR